MGCCSGSLVVCVVHAGCERVRADSPDDVQITRRSLFYLIGSMQPYIVILFTVFRLCQVIYTHPSSTHLVRPGGHANLRR